MIDSKKIKQMVEHVARRGRGVEDRELMHPMREWALGMAITTIIVAVGALISYYFYNEAVNLADSQVMPIAPNVPYDAEKISDAIHMYEEKLEVYQSIVEDNSRIPVYQEEREEPVSDLVVPEEGYVSPSSSIESASVLSTETNNLTTESSNTDQLIAQ